VPPTRSVFGSYNRPQRDSEQRRIKKKGRSGCASDLINTAFHLEILFKHRSLKHTPLLGVTRGSLGIDLAKTENLGVEIIPTAAWGSYQNNSSGTCQAAHMRRGIKRRQAGAGVELLFTSSPNSHSRAPGTRNCDRGAPRPAFFPSSSPRPAPTSSSPVSRGRRR
jgi:hypothetical protein